MMNKRAPRFEDCLKLERFTGGDYCERKHLLCYASNQSEGIILKDLSTDTEKKITAGGKQEGNPAFSVDGTRMLFLSAKDGGRQIFLYDLVSEQVSQLTSVRGSVSEPIWSPDGEWILFASSVSQGKAPQRKHEDEAFVIEEVNYKFDGCGYIPPDGRQQLYIVSTEDGKVHMITDGQTDYLHANWSPDSQSVICVSNRFLTEKAPLAYDLVLIDHVTEQPVMRQLSKEVAVVSYPNPLRPVFTPDGKAVLAGILDMENSAGIGYPQIYLWKFDRETGEGVRILEPDENCYQCVQFPYNAGCGWGMEKLQVSDDGKYVYFVSGWQGQCCMYRLNLSLDDTAYPIHAEKILGGKMVYNGIGRIQNGKMFICRSQSDVPEGYYLLDTVSCIEHEGYKGKEVLSETESSREKRNQSVVTEDSMKKDVQSAEADKGMEKSMQSARFECRLKKVAQSAEDLLAEVSFVCPEDFSVPTLDGESQIHGWIYRPADLPAEKIPAFLYVHGGPHPFYTYGFTMEHQCFAAAGFGVMLCNPRGSSGYGALHQTYERSVDGSAYYDCLQFVDECVRRYDWIDGERLGVTGGSYGGYMTNYIATHSKRFQAYISQRSVASELIMYASSDMSGSSKEYSTFESFMLDMLKKSPVSYVERIDRPFLILQGEDDLRTPMENAHQLFVAIKDVHPELPVKLVIYPHTPHDQPSHPGQLMDYYHEMVEWFRTYL